MSSVLLVRQRTLRQLRPVPRTAEIVEQVSSLKAAGFLRLRLGAQTKSSVGHTDAVRRCQFGWPFPRTARSGSAARRGGGECKTPRVSRRPRRGEAEPRRTGRCRKRLRQFPPRGCCPWPLSPFPSGDSPSSPTNAWLDDGLILPQLSEEFGRFPRRTAVQDRESGGRVLSPLSTGENDSLRVRKTGQRGSSASAQSEPCRPREPGRPSRPGVLALRGTARRPASRPRNRRTPLSFGPFLGEGCERPERPGGRGPLLDDGRESSHRLGGRRGELRKRQTVTAGLAWE